MNGHIRAAAAALAMTLAFAMACCAMQPALAAMDYGGHTYLLDDGGTELTETTDWSFDVQAPSYFPLTDDYWNFTVISHCVNGTGIAEAGSYKVSIYIDDGTTNITKSSNITVSLTADVYGNISFAAAKFVSMTSNDSGVLSFVLTHSGVKDTWSGRAIISENDMTGFIASIVTLFIVVALVVVVRDKLKK